MMTARVRLPLFFCLLLVSLFALVREGRAADYCSVARRCASILIDGRTGAVLSGHEMDKTVYPASLTKVMTLYLVFEALREGRFRLSDTIPVSQRAAIQPPTRIGLTPGQRLTMEDAIEAIAMKSANDIAVAVAEAVGGSQEAFVRRMNTKATALGLRNTVFQNPSGLPDPRQITTARDMALLARRVLTDFPSQRRYFGLPSATIAGRTITGHNRLLTRGECTGGKTGYIRESGFNLVAWKEEGGRLIIGAVFGGDSIGARDRYMADLLRRGAGTRALADLTSPDVGRSALPPSPAFPSPPPRPGTRDITTVIAGLDTSSTEPEICDPEDPEDGADTQAEKTVRSAVPPPAPVAALAPPVSAPVASAPPPAGQGHYLVPPPSALATGYAAATPRPSSPAPTLAGGWAIQVGAYRDAGQARQALDQATRALPLVLGGAFPRTLATPTSSGILHRAQLLGLDERNARTACAALAQQGVHCLTLPPGQSS